MSRYRPPQAPSSPYITSFGYQKLETELREIWIRRRDVTAALAAAAAEGDRSENAEYIYRKKELAGLDRRIRYLQKRLPDLKVVSTVKNGDQVFFGAVVHLDCDDSPKRVHIVGADEIDPATNKISIDSPLAQALLKKQVDDEITITVEDQKITYTVHRIDWPDTSSDADSDTCA